MSRASVPIKRLKFLARRLLGDMLVISENISTLLKTDALKLVDKFSIADYVDTKYFYVPIKFLQEKFTLFTKFVFKWFSHQYETVLDVADEIWLSLQLIVDQISFTDTIYNLGTSLEDAITPITDAVVFLFHVTEETINVVDEIFLNLATHTTATLSDVIDLLGLSREDSISLEDAVSFFMKIPETALNVVTTIIEFAIKNIKSDVDLSDLVDFLGLSRSDSITLVPETIKIWLYKLSETLNVTTTYRALGLEDVDDSASVSDDVEELGTSRVDSVSPSDDMDCTIQCTGGCYSCDICQLCFLCEDCDVVCQQCDLACFYCNLCAHCDDCQSCDATCQTCMGTCDDCYSCEGTCYTCDKCDFTCYSCDYCEGNCYSCDKCDTSCYDCNTCQGSCYSCYACDASCYRCDSCETCDYCQKCAVTCYDCDTCEHGCAVCDKCNATCYNCVFCEGGCQTCQKCDYGCYMCATCMLWFQ